jgi:ElaA protein
VVDSKLFFDDLQRDNRLQWQNLTFNQLNANTLYDILKLRVDVFVVEQACAYPELDDKDRHPETLMPIS